MIFKDKTLISCDNDRCVEKGEFWWCYLNNERNCGVYLDWEKKKMGYKKLFQDGMDKLYEK